MEEQLISFETAKLAKEKGFNIYQTTQFCKGVNPTTTYNYSENQCRMFNDTYYAPTQSLLKKWLREKYKLHIGISVNQFGYGYMYSIIDIVKYEAVKYLTGGPNDKFTYEQALEEGLKNALEMIKI